MQLSFLPSFVELDTLIRKIAPQSRATIPVLDDQVIETSDAQLKGPVRLLVKKNKKKWEHLQVTWMV